MRFLSYLCLLLETLLLFNNVTANFEASSKSLIFVYEVAGSMKNELSHFKGGLKIICDTLSQQRKKTIRDFKAVFFSQSYGAEWVSQISDRDLENLFAKQEETLDESLEMPEISSLKAIVKALEISLPNSFVYVVTNGKPKDKNLLPQVLELIQSKKIQIVFALTHWLQTKPKEYQEIASISGGQMVHLSPTYDMRQFFDDLRLLLPVLSNKVNLLAVNDDLGISKENLNYKLQVDEYLSSMAYSLNGKNLYLRANKIPDDYPNRYCHNSFTENRLIVYGYTIPYAVCPGLWEIRIAKSSSAFSLRIFGPSDFDFIYGFSTKMVNSMENTASRPSRDSVNFVYVTSNNINYQPVFVNCVIFTINGTKVDTIPLEKVEHTENLYYGSFTPIDSYFYLQVNGITEHNKAIQRMSAIAINAVRLETKENSDISIGFNYLIIIYVIIGVAVISFIFRKKCC